MGFDEIKVYSLFVQSYALVSKYFENSCFRFLDDCQTLKKVNLVKSNHLLSMLNHVNKQNWYKNSDGYSEQTNILKTICPTYVKSTTALFNKYTVLSCKNKFLPTNTSCFVRIILLK